MYFSILILLSSPLLISSYQLCDTCFPECEPNKICICDEEELPLCYELCLGAGDHNIKFLSEYSVPIEACEQGHVCDNCGRDGGTCCRNEDELSVWALLGIILGGSVLFTGLIFGGVCLLVWLCGCYCDWKDTRRNKKKDREYNHPPKPPSKMNHPAIPYPTDPPKKEQPTYIYPLPTYDPYFNSNFPGYNTPIPTRQAFSC